MEVSEKVVYRDAHAFKKYENREIRKNKYIEDWVEKGFVVSYLKVLLVKLTRVATTPLNNTI